MRKKIIHITIYLAVTLVAAGMFLITAFFYLINDLKYYTELTLEVVEEKTGYDISISDIDLGIFNGAGLTIENLRVTDKSTQTLIFKSADINILIELLPIFKKHLIVSKIIFNKPELFVFKESDGNLNISDISSIQNKNLVFSNHYKNMSDFSILLKKLIVKNGKLCVLENLENPANAFDHINIRMLLDRKSNKHTISLSAEHSYNNKKGYLFINGECSTLSKNINFKKLYANGNLKLDKMPFAMFLPYIQHFASLPKTNASINSNINFTIEPGLQFKASGNITCNRLSVLPENKPPLKIDYCNSDFSFQLNPESLICKKLNFSLPDNINIDAKLSISKYLEKSPFVDLEINTNSFNITNISKYISALDLLSPAYKNILMKITDGQLALKNLHIYGNINKLSATQKPDTHGELVIKDMHIKIMEHIKPLNIVNVFCEINNHNMLGVVACKWLTGDSHTAQFEIKSLHKNPIFQATILSMCPTKSLNDLTPLIDKDPSHTNMLNGLSGIITAKTEISSLNKYEITSYIDLLKASYPISGSVIKPAGLDNHLSLKFDFNNNNRPLSLSFDFSLKDNLFLYGSVEAFSPLAVNGSYKADNLDISYFKFPSLPDTLQVNGKISGKGSFEFPISSFSQFPLKGSILINEFNLRETGSKGSLISSSLNTTINDKVISIKTGSARIGETYFTLSGNLKSLLPSQGTLSINAGLFDIDNTVITVQRIIKLVEKQAKKPSSSDNNLFFRTDMDIDLKTKKTNFLDWDCGSAIARFSIKKGAFLWDDITLNAGNGHITGSVLFDLSNHDAMQLKLVPSKSNIDFHWFVPGLRENKTLTGTINISGEFSSMFRKESEILPNMIGNFHISITDGIIKKFTTLSNILTFFNLKKLFRINKSDFFSKGMPFDLIDADFEYKDSLMKTDNFFLRGPAMNLSAVGTIDPEHSEIDLVVGAQPLETVGKIINKIPIAGNILTGDNSSLTIGYFSVKGPYKSASVKPMPFKSVSSAVIKIFKSIFNIPLKLIAPKSDKKSIKD